LRIENLDTNKKKYYTIIVLNKQKYLPPFEASYLAISPKRIFP